MTQTLPLTTPPQSVAVIGAGIAGLACATSLMLSVPRVTVFERALHAGGRTASHRERGLEFDFGAQYFTVRDELFLASVEAWLGERVVALWQGWTVELDAGNFMTRNDQMRYVASPSMAALAAHLAGVCEVRYGCEVGRIARGSDGLMLGDSLGEVLGTYDCVVVAVPPPQAERLLAPVAPALAGRLQGLSMTACWSLMLGFEHPPLLMPFDAAYVVNSPLSWIARNSSKPGRAEREAWVAHASPEWSEAHLELAPEAAAAELLEAFIAAVGGLTERPSFKVARLWREAAPITTLGEDFLFDPALGIGLCGDWCLAPRIEGAFLSGLALAQHLLGED